MSFFCPRLFLFKPVIPLGCTAKVAISPSISNLSSVSDNVKMAGSYKQSLQVAGVEPRTSMSWLDCARLTTTPAHSRKWSANNCVLWSPSHLRSCRQSSTIPVRDNFYCPWVFLAEKKTQRNVLTQPESGIVCIVLLLTDDGSCCHSGDPNFYSCRVMLLSLTQLRLEQNFCKKIESSWQLPRVWSI